MRLLAVGIALFTASLHAQAPSRMQLRTEAPAALSVPDKPLTLLFRPADPGSSDCKEVAAAQQELVAFGLTAVVVLDREDWGSARPSRQPAACWTPANSDRGSTAEKQPMRVGGW
jgi:hypothetical protein